MYSQSTTSLCLGHKCVVINVNRRRLQINIGQSIAVCERIAPYHPHRRWQIDLFDTRSRAAEGRRHNRHDLFSAESIRHGVHPVGRHTADPCNDHAVGIVVKYAVPRGNGIDRSGGGVCIGYSRIGRTTRRSRGSIRRDDL